MTILMVTNNYTPYAGGVVSSIQALTEELRLQGHRVIIVTLDFDGANTQEVDVVRLPSIFKCKYKNNPMALSLRIKRKLQEIVYEYCPDIVHVHHPFYLGSAAVKVAQEFCVPTVFTHHTMYEQYLHYIPLPRFLLVPFVKMLVKRHCKRINALITPSASVCSMIVDNYGTSVPVHIIPSPLLSVFLRTEYIPKVLSEPIELVCVARFVPEKNIRALLDMMCLLDERFCLTLIGFGYELASLQDYAYKRCGLSEHRVFFVIKPEKQEIARWYARAHLFVFASQSETQGLVLAEAMASSTPVVALRGTGVVDIVQDGYNGYVCDSIEQMVDTIKMVAHDQTLYAQLQKGAFQTGRAYAPQSLAQHLVAIYHSLIR